MVEMSEIFWSSFITIVSGLILAILAMCYKSKCTEIECGCIKIKRDVTIEEKEHEFDVEHTKNPIEQL
jgi:hypothetical protein